MSKFVGIGVGPGDPDLLTVKAVEQFKTLDILLVPESKKNAKSEAHQIVSKYLPEDLEIVGRHFPMILDKEEMMAQVKEIALEVIEWVKAGKTVGFVTLGDPMLYSTYIYLLKFIAEGVAVETIPGISSYTAIASGLSRPLVEGDDPLMIYPCTADMGELKRVLENHESIVLMKVYKSFETVVQLMTELNLMDKAVAVSNFGKPEQVVHENLSETDPNEVSYFTTILINKRW
jgi:sirohydrochlorin cobaltochelatase